MPDKPNILYIFTDQQEARSMSCVGNPDINTPAMDSIAARGVRFEKAYCSYPLCTPSRASMFTGRMPHEVGITENNQPIADAFRMSELGHVMSGNGYECVYGGKWHIPEIAVPEGHGFRSICGFSDIELPHRCADYLKAKPSEPFFLVASFDNPHNICEWSRDQTLPWGPIEEAPLADCPNLPVNFNACNCEPEVIGRTRQAHLIYRDSVYTVEDWRKYRYAYNRIVEKVDAQIGIILNALRQTGLDKNTIVIFSSDHGDGIGAHRWNQKNVLYEEAARVPLIISVPGAHNAGTIDASHLISNGLDLFPTICDFAQAEIPDGLHGRSFRPIVEGVSDIAWRDHLVTETELGAGSRGLMVRTERYKYCLYSQGKYREQLFDMEKDSGEMVNLAVESRHEKVLQKHRDLLAAWIEETDYRGGLHYSHPQELPRVYGQLYSDA